MNDDLSPEGVKIVAALTDYRDHLGLKVVGLPPVGSDLRCPDCGTIREVWTSPHAPDVVVVVCEPCYRKHLLRAPFVPDATP